MSEHKHNRRDFLKLGAVSALSAVVATAMPSTALAITTKTSDQVKKWDQEGDILIVGSGFAALAAAIEAKKLGVKDVIIFEKMPYFGGNSAINGGLFGAPNTPLQDKEGVKDSPEIMLKDQIASGRGIADENLLRYLTSHAREALQMTLDAGVEYHPYLQQLGGHSVPRTYQTTVNCGAGITQPLIKYAEKLKVKFENRSKFLNFIIDKNDAVIGITVRKGYWFGDENSGHVVNIKAKKGIVMATGGFSQNIALRMAQDPTLTAAVGCTNTPGTTGEGMMEMFKLGAVPVHLAHIQSGPWASPDEGGFGYVSNYSIYNFPHSVAIDTRNGKRFMNEIADRKTRSDLELLCIDDKGNPVPPIMITSYKYAQGHPNCEKVLKYNVGWKFNSLDEIAKKYNIPAAALKAQIKEYNEYTKTGVDKQFNKPMIPLGKDKPVEAPYVVVRLWPKVHYCQGGVQINEKSEVLSGTTGLPIKGLYAAGEVCGGVHGVSRLGSCSIPDCMVFGMTASRSIVKA